MSIKKLYFMAGMPRSGSTLLSSILNQNPRFNAGPNSPVINMMFAMERFKSDDMYKANPEEKSLETIMRSVILNYYFYHAEPVCFDKNRGWTGYMDMLFKYISPDAKIICPVRDIKEILSSFITLLRKNNYPPDSFIDVHFDGKQTDDDRCRYLLGPGILGQSLINLLEGIKKYPDNILLVDYDELVSDLPKTMKRIYKFLGEEYFEHTTNVKQSFTLNDREVYKLEDMHTVRPTIKKISPIPDIILSKFMLDQCDTNEVIQEYEKIRKKV